MVRSTLEPFADSAAVQSSGGGTDRVFEGCKSGACGWLTDSFGICGQIVPGKGRRNLEPKVMATLMTMVKFAVEAAARQYLAFEPADYINIAASGWDF